jgi:hypothetical protein
MMAVVSRSVVADGPDEMRLPTTAPSLVATVTLVSKPYTVKVFKSDVTRTPPPPRGRRECRTQTLQPTRGRRTWRPFGSKS